MTAPAEQRLPGHPLVRRSGSADRVRRLLADVRAGIAFREDTHFHGTRVLPVLRRAVLEMGRRMTAAGLLRDDHDVLHLRWEELESLGDRRRAQGPMAIRCAPGRPGGPSLPVCR